MSYGLPRGRPPAPPAQHLHFVVQPPNGEVGVVLAPPFTVEVHDASHAIITSFIGNITVALGQVTTTPLGLPGTTITGSLTVAAVAGVATFSNVKVNFSLPIETVVCTLIATASGPTSAESASFTVGTPT